MLANQFWKKYSELGVDYDGVYGEQCVDLANAYAREVCGIKDAFTGVEYAYQIYTNYNNMSKLKKNFVRYANELDNYPEKGDFIIWSKERNGYAGHIAVVVKATKNSITVLEQNYDGKGKNRSPKKADGGIRRHKYTNYNNVLGWLRPYRTVSTNGSELRIRRTNKEGSEVVGLMPNGKKFALTGTTNGTYTLQVRYGNTVGYCAKEYTI